MNPRTVPAIAIALAVGVLANGIAATPAEAASRSASTLAPEPYACVLTTEKKVRQLNFDEYRVNVNCSYIAPGVELRGVIDSGGTRKTPILDANNLQGYSMYSHNWGDDPGAPWIEVE
jgi:hypothetical protein